MYSLRAYILDGCGYSKGALELIQNFKIPCDIINVSQNGKEKYKTKYISTFPQIYMIKENSKDSLLIGGYTELNDALLKFKGKKYDENVVKQYIEKNNLSKKAVLRLIELLN